MTVATPITLTSVTNTQSAAGSNEISSTITDDAKLLLKDTSLSR